MAAAQMPEWLYVVNADIDPAVEDDWNRWYDEVHVPEMTECPGWNWGIRYVTEDETGRHYVSLYGLSGPEALETEEFEARRGWRDFTEHVRHQSKLYRRAAGGIS